VKGALEYANLMLTTGSTIPVLAGLSAGCPMVLFPTGSGTEDISEICVEAGLAVACDVNNLDATSLETAAKQCENDASMERRRRKMQTAFQDTKGPEKAASYIENLV
jgi:UDP:flavonoid glycosyltransferase YjiC (YdhE family)